jgi:NitT/TauT family transport system ATP-binding protein
MKLEVKGLEKCYRSKQGDTVALSPTSFEVGDAEFVSLVGPSGCGKSTTLYLIAGLDQATQGEILLDGQPVAGPGHDRGMVFQNYTLFPWLTVRQNASFAFGLANNRDGKTAANAGRADSLLNLMGLRKFYDAYPRQLSGGMKQRVAIARALANRPKVLLMDEPFGALDAQTREEMQELLLHLSRHEKTTILFVTHDVEEAIYLSTRILVFSARPGRIIREITVPFGPARTLDLKLSEPFIRLKREIIGLLQHLPEPDHDRSAILKDLVSTSTAEISTRDH